MGSKDDAVCSDRSTLLSNHAEHTVFIFNFLSLVWETKCKQMSIIISNYWMRQSRIWRILKIKEGDIHRGRRPRCYPQRPKAPEICRILCILRKPNSILIALLFIQNISSFRSFAISNSLFVFPLTNYNTTLSPGFFGQRFNNLQQAALLTSFWRHRCNNFRRAALLTPLIQYCEDSFQMWWTTAGYVELYVWF